MTIPDVWLSFGIFLHQDFLLMYPDFFSGILEFANSLPQSQREEFVLLISDLANSDMSKQEIYEFWNKSGTQLIIDDLPKMFTEIDNVLKDTYGESI